MVVRAASLVLAFALLFVVGARPVSAQDDDGAGSLSGSKTEHRLGGNLVCSATNAFKDQKCSVTCPAQQTADCEDAEGSGVPVCQCTKN